MSDKKITEHLAKSRCKRKPRHI